MSFPGDPTATPLFPDEVWEQVAGHLDAASIRALGQVDRQLSGVASLRNTAFWASRPDAEAVRAIQAHPAAYTDRFRARGGPGISDPRTGRVVRAAFNRALDARAISDAVVLAQYLVATETVGMVFAILHSLVTRLPSVVTFDQLGAVWANVPESFRERLATVLLDTAIYQMDEDAVQFFLQAGAAVTAGNIIELRLLPFAKYKERARVLSNIANDYGWYLRLGNWSRSETHPTAETVRETLVQLDALRAEVPNWDQFIRTQLATLPPDAADRTPNALNRALYELALVGSMSDLEDEVRDAFRRESVQQAFDGRSAHDRLQTVLKRRRSDGTRTE